MKSFVPHLQFHDCAAGWIRFTVAVGDQTTEIHASHIHDPFRDMLRWLERIVAGRQRASFVVNQEGIITQFVAIRKDAEKLGLLIRDIANNGAVHIRKLVDKRKTIDGFYGSLIQFAKSPRYVEEEWAFMSLGDRLTATLPRLGRRELVVELAKLDSEKLRRIFFHVAPSYKLLLRARKQRRKQWLDSLTLCSTPTAKRQMMA